MSEPLLAPGRAAAGSAAALDSAVRIFERLMRGYKGTVALRLWNDSIHSTCNAQAAFTLVVRDPAVLRRLVLERSPLLLAEGPGEATPAKEGQA
jgi:cyclopropane-fatty-acyl-phospholipid synthase